ncbi:thiamine ABC transporter substrate-binding protein [Dermatobacter hominis]|uniref:thiamine ABC transporter substrate-binding protein n=1 Tax=Dermatobacter hominis TaxID=2884263 RepID=UPI001D113016|nr:thiamine ABC transporter substrate-binding protein [Dermatobacter hominis]UDY36128.1 thiamine ABC transporter substrate-binding protein [Dermatobacter hominis]
MERVDGRRAGAGRAPRPHRRRRWPVAVAALLAVALAPVACTDDADGGSGSGSGGDDEVVRLVTYDSFALPEEAAAAFEQQTGATIELVASSDAGGMLTKALLAAGAPEGDVILGIDNTLATRAGENGLLEAFTPSDDRTDEALRLPGELGGLLTPVDRGDVCINVDAGWFAQRGLAPPTTLDDLVDPRYADLLVVTSPVTSSPGLAFLIGTIDEYGDGWSSWWERLRDNGVRIRPSWDDAYNTDYTVSGGDRPLVLSYASSPPAEVVFSEGARTEPASTIMADSCVQQVEYAGLLAGAEHPELGRKLIDFMLSAEWQEALPMSNFVFPAVQGTPLPPEFERWAVLPATSRSMSASEIGEHRDEWIEQWRSTME